MRPFALPAIESFNCGGLLLHAVPVKDPEEAQAVLPAWLHPAEWEQAQSMRAPRRRDEYLRARALLRHLTGTTEPILRLPSGAPDWPPGWHGSITHKDGWVAVTVAQGEGSVGIDAEDPGRMRGAFMPRLCAPVEAMLLNHWAADHDTDIVAVLTLAFSFKEALFKAHFPRGGRMFYFLDAEITSIEAHNDLDHVFTARLQVDTTPTTPAGSVVTGHALWHLAGTRKLAVASCRF